MSHLTPTKGQLIFGREPAAWVALLQAVLAAVSIFVLPLTAEVSGLIVAFVNAVLGLFLAFRVKPFAVAALIAVVQTALPLLVAFGLDLDQNTQGVVLTLTGVLLTFFVRGQVTPTKYPGKVVDAESEVVAEVSYDDPA